MDQFETVDVADQTTDDVMAYVPPTVETTENLPPQCSF